MSAPGEFELQGVVHLVRPTGLRAQNLEELRKRIADAPERSLFFHTRQCQLRDPVGEELAPDDLSGWVGGVVQDRETAERLSFAIQSPSASAEELRAAALEVLDRLPEATRISRDAPADGAFVFLTAESVTLPTGVIVYSSGELVDELAARVHDDAGGERHGFGEPARRPRRHRGRLARGRAA